MLLQAKAIPRTREYLKGHSKLGPPSKPDAPVVTRTKQPPKPGAAFGNALTPEQVAKEVEGMSIVGSRPASATWANRTGSAASSRASSRPGTAKRCVGRHAALKGLQNTPHPSNLPVL
jgi:hypothetical protein